MDINTVTAEDLKINISLKLAEKIVDYRKKYGPFRNFNDLEGVSGISRQKINKLKGKFYISSDIETVPPSQTGLLPHTRQIVDKEQECTSVTEQDFFQNIEETSNNDLILFHANTDSLIKKKGQLGEITNKSQPPDVICVSETRKNLPQDSCQFENYSSFWDPPQQEISVGCWKGLVKGGVAMYVKESLKFKERTNLKLSNMNCCENVWVEITTEEHQRNVVVGAVYRHPGADFNDGFAEKLMQTVRKIKEEGKLFYILGDININMLGKSKTLKKHIAYCDKLKENGCKLILTKVTRPRSKTLLDHIYTNNEAGKTKSRVLESKFVSDHYPVYCIADVRKGEYPTNGAVEGDAQDESNGGVETT